MPHEMKLQPSSFDAMKAGIKTIECRLNDEKRQQIRIGDTIVFRREPELHQELETEVIDILHYASFDELSVKFPPKVFGFHDKEEFERVWRSFYSQEEEKKNGVVGVRIRLKK